MNSIEDLAAELELLRAEHDILDTFYRYAKAMDYGIASEWEDVFAEDGVFEVVGEFGPAARRVSGRSELRAYLATKDTPRPGIMKKHIYCNPRIHIEGKSATVDSYFLILASTDGVPRLQLFGIYHDRVVKEPDGMWRLKERIADCEATATDHRLAAVPWVEQKRSPGRS